MLSLKVAAGVGGVRIVAIPVNLALAVLLARTLGPTGFGEYSFAISLGGLLSLPAGAGFANLVMREVARAHARDEYSLLRGIFLRSVHVCIAVGVIELLCAALTSALGFSAIFPGGATVLWAAAALGPLLGFLSLQAGFILGLHKHVVAQLPVLLLRSLISFLLIFGYFLLHGEVSLPIAAFLQVSAVASACALGAIMRLRFARLPVALVTKYDDISWRSAAVPFLLIEFVGMLNAEIGIQLLAWLSSPADVAALRVAQNGAQIVAIPLAVVNIVIAPRIAAMFKNGDIVGIQATAVKSSIATLACALTISAPLVLFGHTLISFLFGERYSQSAYIPLLTLIVGQLINVFFGSVALILSMCGRERDTLFGQLFAVGLAFLLAMILIPPYKAFGAALAVSGALICWNILLTFQLRRRLGIRASVI